MSRCSSLRMLRELPAHGKPVADPVFRLLTCPKQSTYLCSHTDAPVKLAALIISALSLQAFRAILNINFASLRVSKGFLFFQGTQLTIKLNCQIPPNLWS